MTPGCCLVVCFSLCSTITHQPPEVLLEGSAAFTPAADVYAWGVLLWVSTRHSAGRGVALAWPAAAAPTTISLVFA